MTLSCSVKVSKNNRYGVYKRGMGAEEGGDAGVVIAGTGNECSNNGKTGICSTGGVGIDVIQVENNGGYGIYASGKMLINEIGHYKDISTIANNGKDGIYSKKQYLGLGGIVNAFYLDVVNNHGIGIRADSNLTMNGGKICDNAKGNLVVGGSKNLTNVTVCESVLSTTTQGNAMLDTEIPDNGNSSPEDEK